MKRIFIYLMTTALFALYGTTAWAQLSSLENGKVYHFTCGGTTSVSLGASAVDDVAAVATDISDKAQQWLVTKNGNYYTLRNLANGHYLSGAGTSTGWSLSSGNSNETNLFELATVGGSYNAIRSKSHSSNGYAWMHKDAQNNIVGWENGAVNSQWTIAAVDISADELAANWKYIEEMQGVAGNLSSFQSALDNLFADKACTTLKKQFANVAAIEADADYKTLPAALQAMVKKVYTDDWTEDNVDSSKDGWDNDYARKFRVQMYEPYSVAGAITSFLRINAHANNDNPTGIYPHERGMVYVMVEGAIAEGASLRLVDAGVNNRIGNPLGAGVELKEGLNAVPYYVSGGHLYVCYNVSTYDASTGSFPYKLSDFSPLKIHIEGGAINGYYNACGDFRATSETEDLWGGVDNDADWNYYEERANLGVLPLLGHRQVLLFQLEDTDGNKGMRSLLTDYLSVPTVPYNRTKQWSDYGMGLDPNTGKINIMMEAWDRIMYSELATLGLVSRSQLDKMNSFYPRWKSDGTYAEIYNYGSATVNGVTTTYQEFCEGRDYSEYFNHHGVALGTTSGYMYGGWDHCGYHINTFGSIVSSIANEAGPTWGPAHEIGHQHQGVINLNGQTEVTNNFFSNVAVWYMGMGTSRYNGSEGNLEHVLAAFNTEGNDAYTNNIWALTHMYYRLWLYYHLAGNNTQFWPRLFELCRQKPIENGTSIDGGASLLRFYQHACDAAGEDLTEFFRAHGYLEVMDNRLVGDYTNATYNVTQEQIDVAVASVKAKNYPVNYAVLLINDGTAETTLQHDGATKRALWDGSASAELGSVNDFIDGTVSVGDYSAEVSSDGNVTMSGEGGVGFIILDSEGNIVSFSNKKTFKLSDEAAYLVATGNASVSVVASDNTVYEAEVDLTAVQGNLLQSLISKVEVLPMESEATYTHIGFYSAPASAPLRAALAQAKETAESGIGIATAYELLYNEYTALLAADPVNVKVQFNPSLTYTLKNYAYPLRTMTVSGSTVYANTGVDLSSAAAQWQFVPTATEGVYNVKNMDGDYCPTIYVSTAMTVTSDQGSAGTYILEDLGAGLWAISLTPSANNSSFHSASNDSYKVVGWNTGSDATRWYLTAVEADADAKAEAELLALVEKTGSLVNSLATFESEAVEDALPLQTAEGAPCYIWSNAPQSDSPVANLLDNSSSTFFHSNWQSSTAPVDGLDHHLTVELGTDNSLSTFKFYYQARTGAGLGDYPKTIKVQGSNNGTDYVDIVTVEPRDANGGVIQNGAEWTSDVIECGIRYSYLRFMVTATTTNKKTDGHIYFHMAEFKIYPASTSAVLRNEYAEYEGVITTENVAAAWEETLLAKALLADGSTTNGEITECTASLQAKYDALYAEYMQVVDSEREKLQALVVATDELIDKVGEATVVAGGDVNLLGKLYAERPYEAGGTADSDYSSAENGYNLLDGNTGTHFHSDYNTATMIVPPFIRVDLGEGESVSRFSFNYTTRSNGNNCPRRIDVYGSNEADEAYQLIKSFTSSDIANPLPTDFASWDSGEVEATAAYRYFKFVVTESESSNNGGLFFVMSEFGFRKLASVSATVNEAYKESVSNELLIETRRTVDASMVLCGYAADGLATVVQLKAQQIQQQAAYDALNAAVNASVLPDPAKYYALRCNYQNRYVYVNETNMMQWNGEYDSSSSRAVWQFENVDEAQGIFRMKSLHTDGYLGTLSNNAQAALGADAAEVIISPSESFDGAVVFSVGDNALGLYAHGSNNRVIGYTNTAEANHYYLEEVSPEDIHFDVTMVATYSSVMLNYNAVVPAGVTAYIATGIDGGHVTLETVAEEGGVLPANTPVILYRQDEETLKRFVYTDEQAVSDTSASLLEGRLCVDYIECLDGYKYYKLLLVDGEAKMYHMYEEFDKDGTFGPNDIYKLTNDGGYIKCSANKIYMVLPVSEAGMSAFDVRIDGATGVVEVEDVTDGKAIYDLQGRKVGEIVTPGFYIIGGRKVFVE